LFNENQSFEETTMSRIQFLKLSAVVVAMLTAAPLAIAQTGPTGGATTGGAGGGAPVQQGSKLTADRLANILRADGAQVEVRSPTNNAQVVVATIVRDGWRFVVEFEFINQGNMLNLICPVGNSNTNYTSQQLLEILKKSYDLPVPMHFSFRSSDGRLCLEQPCYVTANLSDAQVRAIVDFMVQKLRETYPVWNVQ
jgi:hypothetical protein